MWTVPPPATWQSTSLRCPTKPSTCFYMHPICTEQIPEGYTPISQRLSLGLDYERRFFTLLTHSACISSIIRTKTVHFKNEYVGSLCNNTGKNWLYFSTWNRVRKCIFHGCSWLCKTVSHEPCHEWSLMEEMLRTAFLVWGRKRMLSFYFSHCLLNCFTLCSYRIFIIFSFS